MSGDTRILLADDHALVRRGVRLILDDSPGLHVVAEASDGVEAVALALAGGVDLVVLDIAMPRMTGLQAARAITAHTPHPKLLMLSMYDNEQYFSKPSKPAPPGTSSSQSPTKTSSRPATPPPEVTRSSTPASSAPSSAATSTASAAARPSPPACSPAARTRS